jgi:hypothetical protein
VRDLGPAALRRVLDDLLASKVDREHAAAFVRQIRKRMYGEPHRGLTAAEVRRLNKLWRAWREG